MKKYISIILSIVLSVGSVNMVFADEIVSDTISEPEAVAEDLVEDKEETVFPIEEQEQEQNMDVVTAEPQKQKKRFFVKNAEDLPRNQNKASTMSTISEQSEKELYKLALLDEQKYQNHNTGKVNINKATGNVNYSYNLATVPGKNGSVMSLDIEYNSTESRFAISGADIGDSDYYQAPFLDYAADERIAAGWEFSNVNRSCGDYLKLRDGRLIKTRSTYLYYQDFTIENQSSGTLITYTDGSKECISYGYLQYEEDKYGNRITYEYDEYKTHTDKTAYRLLSVTDSLNRKITINYYTSYIEIVRPDNTKIRLNINETNEEHLGTEHFFDNTLPVRTLDSIYDMTLNEEIADFEYERFAFTPIRCVVSLIMWEDYEYYMAMTSVWSSFGEIRNIEYSIETDSKPLSYTNASKKYWYLCAKNDYISSMKNNASYSYSYDFEKENRKICKELSKNNQVIETTIEDKNKYYQSVYERKNGNDILKQSTETIYYKGDYTRPYTITSKIYNDNGNYITNKKEYSYNEYGDLLTVSESVDDNIYMENTYNYHMSNYHALSESVMKKGSTIFLKTYYGVNSLGDVTSEKIYNGDGDLQSNTAYTYSNNNLSGKIVYSVKDASVLQRENYTYTGAYLTRAYTLNQYGTTISDIKYTYDNNTGRVLSVQDANGTEIIQYDSLGRITRETHADGTYKQIGYDYIDHEVAVSDEAGYTNEYKYNAFGKLVYKYEYMTYYDYANRDNCTLLQNVSYDAVGNPISVTDAMNNTTTIAYDAFGRQTSVKKPGNSSTTKAKYYDVFFEGNNKYSLYLTISETGRISCEYYDVYGRLVKTALIKNYSSFSESSFNNIYQMPSNAQLVITSRYVYDDLGRVIEQYDGENRPTYYTYDSMGNVINMVQGDGLTTDSPKTDISYEYDSAGRLIKTTQGTHITTYEYDYAGRLTKITDPMGYTETYTYDTAGNVKTSKDKNGAVTTNTYNNRGLLSKTSKGSESIEYTYDGKGNLLTSKDSSGIIRYTYNSDGTLASKFYPDGKSITYNSYNANKALLSMTDCLGNKTNYTYNAKGEITSIGEVYSGVSGTKTTSYAYNTDGSLQKVTYPNSMTSAYTYDYAGRVSNLTNKITASSTYSAHDYTYDNSGNVTQKSENILGTSQTTKYTYDDINRLKSENISSVGTVTYGYDQYNNLISERGLGNVDYFYDNNNRLTSLDDKRGHLWESFLSYDKNGNLITHNTQSYYSNLPYERDLTYSYDAWGRLTQFSYSEGDTASYSYYSDGLRSSKIIGENTTKYYYNGDNVINETLNGNSYATNVLGVNGYVSRKQNNTVGYLFQNAHGDVLSVYSDSQSKLAEYSYNAWGDIQSETQTSSFMNNPLRYCGEYYDYESGMTYLRARYYDSSIKRFISEDPIKDGLNWYAYCGNNPVMFVDPSGMKSSEQKQYEKNSEYEIWGFIYGQGNTPTKNMKYGFYNLDYNGCELIAIYNALFQLGDRHALASIIYDASKTKGVTWGVGAIFGSHPDKLGLLLEKYGHNYVSTENRSEFNGLLQKGGTYIVSFWTGKKYQSTVHTVMFNMVEDNKIEVYNYHNDSKSVKPFYASGGRSALDVMLAQNGDAIILYKVE